MKEYELRINDRRLIDGPADNLMCISPLKHTWAREFWKRMLANTWFPTVVDMSRDVKMYKLLSDAERGMYDKALAFLSNLDGIQFNNLTNNIGRFITSPEISMCISRQAFEEAVHVDSYATLIEAVSADPHYIYGLFARDGLLAAKNEHVLRQSAILGNDYTKRNFALAVCANVILEGIYFYSGFLAFYTLARSGKMLGSADMIRLIQRDEVVHLELFVQMFHTLREENPEIFDDSLVADIIALFREAVALEISWGKHIIKGGILGLSDGIIEDYIKHLANKRLAMLDIGEIYDVKNPVEWVEEFSHINNEESNFFESRVKAYSTGTLEW